MIIALFALSIAMIVGGIASVVQGFPFVRLESGLAMTIAGATTASAGAVLLGLAVLAGQVRRLAASGRAAAPAVAAPMPPPPLAAAPAAVPSFLAQPDPGASEPQASSGRRPAVAAAAGFAGGLAAGGAYGAGRPEPTFEESAHPADRSGGQAETEPPLPDLVPADEPVQAPAEPIPAEPPPLGVAATDAPARPDPDSPDVEADLFAPAEPETDTVPASGEPVSAAEPGAALPDLRPAIEDKPAAAPPEPAPTLDVVGTYSSGGNTYVMFSDGSIEAETPRGRFTFDSLDELKAFVEAGGEAGGRGAA